MELCYDKNLGFADTVEQRVTAPAKKNVTTKRLSELADEELVTLVKNSSDAAFAELTKRYMQKSYSIAYKFVGDAEAAKDLSQDVFIKIYATIDSFKDGSKFFSWYYRILLNHCINYKRRQKIVSLIPFSEAFNRDDKDFEHNMLKDEVDSESVSDNTALVRKAIDNLSPKHRKVIVLFDLEGFPQEEIAKILGTSIGTVRSRLHYARKNLKKILKQYLRDT